MGEGEGVGREVQWLQQGTSACSRWLLDVAAGRGWGWVGRPVVWTAVRDAPYLS